MSNEVIVSPQEAAAEIMRRRAARTSLIGFTEYTKLGYKTDPFHHTLASALEKIESGETKRLMIFAPPRHGKSELSTRRFPAWYLARNPTKTVISASYNGDFAKGFGRDVRNIIFSREFEKVFPHVGIRSDNRAADEWQTTDGGTYFAVGVGTGTTGRGAHLFLIDDPIKDRKDADSPTFREDQWNWYRDVVYTRLEEDAAIIMTLTRWHHDDVAGRAIELMNQGSGQPWEILSLPALPEPMKDKNGRFLLDADGRVIGDPLGRQLNEPLAPQRFSYVALKDRQEVLGERSWSALYQQRPIAQEGGMFRSSWFKTYDTLPDRRTRVRAWDLAATTDGDFTVGTLMSRCKDGIFYIENVIRFRGSPLEVERKILETAKNDGKSVKIVLPQDPGQAGKDQASNYLRKLAGWSVRAVRPTGSKETRASAFAAQVEAGHVKLPPGETWQTRFLDELSTFPLGAHDDQVDSAADAFNALLGPKRAAILDM